MVRFFLSSVFLRIWEKLKILECEVYEYGNYHPQFNSNEYRAASGG